MQDKKFYQLTGDESDLREVQISEAQVTVRLIPHPDQKPTCRLAGLVAELVEVVEVQKR